MQCHTVPYSVMSHRMVHRYDSDVVDTMQPRETRLVLSRQCQLYEKREEREFTHTPILISHLLIVNTLYM